MPFQPVPNVASFKMIYNVHGAFCENVLYFRSIDGWDKTRLDDTITMLEAWHDAQLAPLQSANAVLRTISARSETAAEAAASERGITVNGEGNLAGSAEPNNVTLAVKLTTGLTGRSARGRVYHIGIPGSAVVGNTVTLAYRDQVLNAYLDLITRAQDESLEWVIVSRYTGGAKPVPSTKRPLGRPLPISGVSADTDLDSMRRRLNGRGI